MNLINYHYLNMFFLLSIEDKMLLQPEELMNSSLKQFSYKQIVYLKMRHKYISRILLGHGIVVSITKYLIKSNLIVEIEGLINVEYNCTLILFKPQPGDILTGKVISSDIKEIIVDCDVIKVKVPSEQVMKPNNFNDTDNIWYWLYNDAKYYYDIGEVVRVKVLDVNFKSKNDISQMITEQEEKESDKLNDVEKLNENNKTTNCIITADSIMEIGCTLNEEGLGPVDWWNEK